MKIESLAEHRIRARSLVGEHILVVDDQSTVRKSLQVMLEQSGAVVTTAVSGEEAIELLNFSKFSLVLLDILLPGMDGRAVLKAIRNKYTMPDLPVIMVTVNDKDEDVVEALSMGANDYLVKPVDLPVLRARIQTHLAYKKAEAELLSIKNELEQRVEERTTSLLETNKALVSEITERKDAEEKIRHLAYHDELTGLPNSRLGKDRLCSAIALTKRNKSTLALLYMDLDGFKDINDNLGHAAGDQVLINVAERMLHCVRDSDTVARIGGDEFIVVLNQIGAKTSAEIVAEKLIKILTEPYSYEEKKMSLSVSIGIALYPDHADTVDELIKMADRVMYTVKNKGKNNYAFA